MLLKRFLIAVWKRCDFFHFSGSDRCDGLPCSSSMPYCPYGREKSCSAFPAQEEDGDMNADVRGKTD